MTPRITADQASDRLGVPLRTVQQMAASGRLPGAVKIGRDGKARGTRLAHEIIEQRHLEAAE